MSQRIAEYLPDLPLQYSIPGVGDADGEHSSYIESNVYSQALSVAKTYDRDIGILQIAERRLQSAKASILKQYLTDCILWY